MTNYKLTWKQMFMLLAGILALLFINLRPELSSWLGASVETVIAVLIVVMFIVAIGLTGLWSDRGKSEQITGPRGGTPGSWYLICGGLLAVSSGLGILIARAGATGNLTIVARPVELFLFLLGFILIGLGLKRFRRRSGG